MATGLALGPIVFLARWACSVSWYRYTFGTKKAPSGLFSLRWLQKGPSGFLSPSYTDPGQGLFAQAPSARVIPTGRTVLRAARSRASSPIVPGTRFTGQTRPAQGHVLWGRRGVPHLAHAVASRARPEAILGVSERGEVVHSCATSSASVLRRHAGPEPSAFGEVVIPPAAVPLLALAEPGNSSRGHSSGQIGAFGVGRIRAPYRTV